MVETPDGLRRRALGGDVIRLKPNRTLDYRQMDELRQQPFVRDRQVTRHRDQSLRLIVDDTATALPAAISWMDAQGLTVEEAGEYSPPFDDVFVMLLEQEEAQRQETEQAHA